MLFRTKKAKTLFPAALQNILKYFSKYSWSKTTSKELQTYSKEWALERTVKGQ